MTFRVEFADLAAERFKKIPQKVQDQVARNLRQVAENPRRHLVRIMGVDAFRVRVGDYRVILDVKWPEEILHILTIGHRSKVYR